MVNGNYILYGERPPSESEIVNDHVQPTPERKNKRKTNRTATELQQSLKTAQQLDNETDSVKYEKKIKEPRLLRYVSNKDVEEHFVNHKFESFDIKPTEDEPPRRYAFTKKPKNPSDGSVNYAYSRSSSSCSSPGGNLPTISEQAEHYESYRSQCPPSPIPGDFLSGYESKLEKYFSKPKEKNKPSKLGYNGSHPDSLYRVTAGSGDKVGRIMRAFHLLRWPAALLTVCVALAVFVYFLMPDTMDTDSVAINGTYLEANIGAYSHHAHASATSKPGTLSTTTEAVTDAGKRTKPSTQGSKTTEIDFYEADNYKHDDISSILHALKDTKTIRKLPVPPVFPSHIVPEVQYGNEKADVDNLRTPRIKVAGLEDQDSTVKPQITQKPEKPLAVYFKDGDIIISEAVKDEYVEREDIKAPNTKISETDYQTLPSIRTEAKQQQVQEHNLPSELQSVYRPINADLNFTSGHSKLFGISIEDAERYKSTTQSSLYNTKVSPTLPVWRDGDSTTSKYPVAEGQPQCQSTRLALCRGVLPYDLASVASAPDGGDFSSWMPQIEALVATNCSERLSHFLCALMEPECSAPPYPPKLPCYNLCQAVVDSCASYISRSLAPIFNCQQYPVKGCMAARVPCFMREGQCGDGSCVPRDRICDGTRDCPGGEDEAHCLNCYKNEFKCKNGGCIPELWLCDGYDDCPGGDDELQAHCEVSSKTRLQFAEQAAGSAPVPSYRAPNRLLPSRNRNFDDNENSKELLMTSDTTNALKRNYTRRPSPSRLSPYPRPSVVNSQPYVRPREEPEQIPVKFRKFNTHAPNAEFKLRAPSSRKYPVSEAIEDSKLPKVETQDKEQTGRQFSGETEPEEKQEKEELSQKLMKLQKFSTYSTENQDRSPKYSQVVRTKMLKDKETKKDDRNDDEQDDEGPDDGASFFDDFEKDAKRRYDKSQLELQTPHNLPSGRKDVQGPKLSEPLEGPEELQTTRLDKTINNLERVINGGELLRKAQKEEQIELDADKNAPPEDIVSIEEPKSLRKGAKAYEYASQSAHATPSCPSGELRCVDGRCITLAQLCDGTIDCSDHADEDNCYT